MTRIDLTRIKAQILRGAYIESQRSNVGLLEDSALHYEWMALCSRWVEDEMAMVDEIERLQKRETPPPTIIDDGEEILFTIKLTPNLPGTKDSFVCSDKKSVYVSFFRDLTNDEHERLRQMGLQATATPIEYRYYIRRIEGNLAS